MSSPLQVQLLAALTFAHVLADFVIQTDRDVEAKRRFLVLLRHALVVAVLSYLVSGFWYLWYVPLVILVTHLGIDWAKSTRSSRSLTVFSLDQLAHAAVIVGISILIPRYVAEPSASYWLPLIGALYIPGLVLAAGFMIAVNAGAVIVGSWVGPFSRQLQADREASEKASPGKDAGARVGFVEGGRVIGMLERALIFVFVLVDQPAGIGFLIAAKSILRFGDIGAGARRKEAEYIIIGTFLSFVFGIPVAYLTRYLLFALG